MAPVAKDHRNQAVSKRDTKEISSNNAKETKKRNEHDSKKEGELLYRRTSRILSPTSCESPVPPGEVAHATWQGNAIHPIPTTAVGTSGRRPEIPPRPRAPPAMLDLIRTYGPVPRQESAKPHHSSEPMRSSGPENGPDAMDELDGELSDMPTTFQDDWDDIIASVDRMHQDYGVGFLVAAHGEGGHVLLHATKDLYDPELINSMEALISENKFLKRTSCDIDKGVTMTEETQGIDEEPELDSEKLEGDDETSEKILKDLKNLLIKNAEKAGFNVLNANGGLKWSTLAEAMVEHGIYLDNYPYILMPQESRTKKNKGIQNLRRTEQKMLIQALRSEVNQCQFMRLPKPNQRDIARSIQPLIIFAPPDSKSHHKQGKRFFWNGETDWKGHPRCPAALLVNDDSGVNHKEHMKTAVHLRSQALRKKRPRSKTSDGCSESSSTGKRSNGSETSHRGDRSSSRSERPAPKMVAFDPSAAVQSGGPETSQRWSQSLKHGDDTDGWKYHHHDASPLYQMHDCHYDINEGQNRYSGYYPDTVRYTPGPNHSGYYYPDTMRYTPGPNGPNYTPALRKPSVYPPRSQGHGATHFNGFHPQVQNRMDGPPFSYLMPQNGFPAYFNQGNRQNQQSGPYWQAEADGEGKQVRKHY